MTQLDAEINALFRPAEPCPMRTSVSADALLMNEIGLIRLSIIMNLFLESSMASLKYDSYIKKGEKGPVLDSWEPESIQP